MHSPHNSEYVDKGSYLVRMYRYFCFCAQYGIAQRRRVRYNKENENQGVKYYGGIEP